MNFVLCVRVAEIGTLLGLGKWRRDVELSGWTGAATCMGWPRQRSARTALKVLQMKFNIGQSEVGRREASCVTVGRAMSPAFGQCPGVCCSLSWLWQQGRAHNPAQPGSVTVEQAVPACAQFVLRAEGQG